MKWLTKDDWQSLRRAQGETCLSLYLPTVRAGKETTGQVELLEQQPHCASDLLDLAALQTWIHGGEIHLAQSREEIPGNAPLAVLLRY